MVGGLPVEEAVEIFNDIVKRTGEETHELARSEWRLRAIARSRPGDVVIEVALLYALLMNGKADEANRLAERLWPRRASLEVEQLSTFLFELTHLGQFEKAADLLEKLIETGGRKLVPAVDAIAVAISWGLGDIDGLSKALAEAPSPDWGSWPAFLDELRRVGLAKYLPERQRVVRTKIVGRQCFTQLLLTSSIPALWEMTRYVYISDTYEDRVTIEEEIRTELDVYFAQFGDIKVDHWDYIAELIASVSSVPCWHKDFVFSG